MKWPKFAVTLSPVLLLSSLSAGANTGGRSYSFHFQNGNLISNWSFEEKGQDWFDENGFTARVLAKSDGISASSGSFVGKFSYKNVTGTLYPLMSMRPIRVEPGTDYNLSMFVYQTENSGGVKPLLRFFSDIGTASVGTIMGPNYPVDIGRWIPYTFNFTTPAGTQTLWLYGAATEEANAGGTIYFDDIVLEKGTFVRPRDKVGEVALFTDDVGNTLQSHAKLSGGLNPVASRKYLLQATQVDVFGRTERSYAPFAYTGKPSFDPTYDADAKFYYNGTNGKPDLGSYPYSAIKYADEPTERIEEATMSGDSWSSLKLKEGYSYVNDLAIPADIESGVTDVLEGKYKRSWSKDVNGNYSVSWENKEGLVIQSARNLDKSELPHNEWNWVYTQFQYHPNGLLKSVLTPLDVSSGTKKYARIQNYNSQGLMTSMYQVDRGLTKFWYNRRGQIRYSQHESQPEDFHYTEYAVDGRVLSCGIQHIIVPFEQEFADRDSYGSASDKSEQVGFIYGNIEGISSRVGVAFQDLVPGVTLENGTNRLVCEYNRNAEAPKPGFSLSDRLVAQFYSYDKYGLIKDSYKYIGPLRSLAQKVQHISYQYDDTHRLVSSTLYDGAASSVIVSSHSFQYDGLGRVSKVTGKGGSPICKYEYYDWGDLKSMVLGGQDDGVSGTKVEYVYHGHGWLKEVKATQLATQKVIYQQDLGYESKAIDKTSVPAPAKNMFDGTISQQLYKYTDDVEALGSVRMVNYEVDALGRLTNADFRRNSNPSPLDGLQAIKFDQLVWNNSDQLDGYFEYDDNGRITRNKSSGVPDADAAVYHYKDGSNQLDHVTGRLDPDGKRSMSPSGTFAYDAKGRLVSDFSKKLTVRYGWNNLPTEYAKDLGNGNTEVSVLFYDASGNPASRISLIRKTRGLGLIIVGNNESEPAGLYDYPDLTTARMAVASRILGTDPALLPDEIQFMVVSDRGTDIIAPASQEIIGFSNPNGIVIPLTLVGIVKDSPAYQDLLHQYLDGTAVSSMNLVNLSGDVDRQWLESYDGNGLVSNSSAITGLYGAGAKLGRILPDGTEEFFIKNHIGSTVRVVGTNGEFESQGWVFDYKPYGASVTLLDAGSGNKSPETFTGMEKSDVSDLYDFPARGYDADLGLFISPDPMAQFFNPYAYGSGNPMMGTDPSGMTWVTNPDCSNSGDRSCSGEFVWVDDGNYGEDGIDRMKRWEARDKEHDRLMQLRQYVMAVRETEGRKRAAAWAKADHEAVQRKIDRDIRNQGGDITGNLGTVRNPGPPRPRPEPAIYGRRTDYVEDFYAWASRKDPIFLGTILPENAEQGAFQMATFPLGSVGGKFLSRLTPTVGDLVIAETMGGTGNITSRFVLSSEEALATGEKFLGQGYTELGKPGSGVFRSLDGLRQFRIDANSIAGGHAPNVPHIHFETYTPGARFPTANNHVPFYE